MLRPILISALLGGAVLLYALAALKPAGAGTSATIALDMDPSDAAVQNTSVQYAGTSPIAVNIVIQDANEIGAFEFGFSFNVVELEYLGWTLEPFLGSTGRMPSCQEIRTENTTRIGCTTAGPSPGGPSGDGVLAKIIVRPRFSGTTCLNPIVASTADISGSPLPTTGSGGCIDVSATTATPTPTSSVSVTPTPVFPGAVIALDVDPGTPGLQGSVTIPPGATEIFIDVVVFNADHIGAFEFLLYFDAAALHFDSWTLGPFLPSTGRIVSCQDIITENTVRVGCGTEGPPPPDGPSGDGVLATLRFIPLAGGTTCVSTLLVETAEIFGHALPTIGESGCLITNGSPTPTATPTAPSMEKIAESCVATASWENCNPDIPAANLWLCVNGPCAGPGEGNLVVFEYARNVVTGDQNGDTIIDGLGAYEFTVEYDNLVIQSLNPADVVFAPTGSLAPYPAGADGVIDGEGAARAPATCSFSLIQENQIRFGCTTSGPLPVGPTGDFDLARLYLIPHPDLVNDVIPGNDNGIVTVLKDNGCELADVFGHPVIGSVNGGLLPTCDDLAVTVRILEGDMNLDCTVDVEDAQLIAFRYGSNFGSTLYSRWYDLEPALQDLDVDIKDVQKVFGRSGSTCQAPIPWQPPLPPPAPFGG